MKRIFFFAFALVASLAASAAQYCHSELVANGHTAYITCRSLGSNQYEFVFESADAFTGYNAAGSNFYANVNGTGGYHVSENLVQDGTTLSVTITSTAVPTFYVGDFFVNYANGEAHFVIPTDADFSATCEGEEGNPGGNQGNEGEGNEEQGGGTAPATGWDAIEWLGNGTAVEAYTNKYKIRLAEGQQVANIQQAPWDDNNAGIYTWFESGVTSVSVPAGIQGAGVLLHMDAFTAQETEVTVVAATKTYVFTVYYADGTPAPATALENAAVSAEPLKFFENGRVIILRDGVRYDALGRPSEF